MDKVVDFINVNRDRYVDEMKRYLAIPSISALPEHSADVRRAAEWTAEALRSAGMQNVRLIDTPGHPVVYGDWLGAPGKGRALSVGEVKFSGMVLPTMKKLEYIVELKRVIRRKFTLGTGDGWLKADGETIYTAKDLRVGLFQAGETAPAQA